MRIAQPTERRADQVQEIVIENLRREKRTHWPPRSMNYARAERPTSGESVTGPVICPTPSGAGPRLDHLEVANGAAVVLPLLLEDRVQARESGLAVLRGPGVDAPHGEGRRV